jgi:hypothetical protein
MATKAQKAQKAQQTLETWLESAGWETHVTLWQFDPGYGEGWIKGWSLWGREDWLGEWAASRPDAIRVIRRSKQSITYEAQILSLGDDTWEITETIDPPKDRWGRRYHPWDLTAEGLLIHASDDDRWDGGILSCEEEAKSVAKRHPDQMQVIWESRAESGGTAQGEQWMENKASSWSSVGYLMIIGAPGVTEDQVKEWAEEIEEETDDSTEEKVK